MEKRNNCFVTQQVVSILPDGQRKKNKEQLATLLQIIIVVLLVGEMCTSKRKNLQQQNEKVH
jgi:hypothetical protein